MTNLKSNLRKVATIIACLTVATMFASCGGNKDNDDDGNGGGKIDKKLVGSWEWKKSNSEIYAYNFRADGTFTFSIQSSFPNTKSGNYKISDGKITFTNIVNRYLDGEADYPKTVVAEYRFMTEKLVEKDEEYLHLAVLDYPQLTYLPLEGFWARWTKK